MAHGQLTRWEMLGAFALLLWQVLFEVPGLGLRVHGFSVMLVAATASAVFLTSWRARRESIDPEVVFELAVWLLTGGFVGARALFLIRNPGQVHSFWDVFKVWQGGIVFYGCILGGLIGSLMYWRRRPFPFLAMCDAVAPSLAIGIALGRLGCLLNGCCFGAVCDQPWAMTFPAGSLPWLHHVDQGWLSPLAARSLPGPPRAGLCDPRRPDPARLALGLLPAPPEGRPGDGPADGDVSDQPVPDRDPARRRPGLRLGLTLSQLISAGLFPCGLLAWWWISRKPAGRYADLAGAIPAPKQGQHARPVAVAGGR